MSSVHGISCGGELGGGLETAGAQQHGFEPLAMCPVLGRHRDRGRIAGGLQLLDQAMNSSQVLGGSMPAFSRWAFLYQIAERSP